MKTTMKRSAQRVHKYTHSHIRWEIKKVPNVFYLCAPLSSSGQLEKEAGLAWKVGWRHRHPEELSGISHFQIEVLGQQPNHPRQDPASAPAPRGPFSIRALSLLQACNYYNIWMTQNYHLSCFLSVFVVKISWAPSQLEKDGIKPQEEKIDF